MKEAIHTDRAPAAIGPYSQAVRAGGFLFTSGQIPVDPAAGDIPAGIKAQAQQSLNNIAAILAQAGLDRSAVVKTTVFLKDMNDFAAMNEVYAQFFEGPAYPARSAVEVARLPKDVGGDRGRGPAVRGRNAQKKRSGGRLVQPRALCASRDRGLCGPAGHISPAAGRLLCRRGQDRLPRIMGAPARRGERQRELGRKPLQDREKSDIITGTEF